MLQLNKWEIIKLIRNQERDKLTETLETMKWAKAWCINAAFYQLIARTIANFMAYRQKQLDRALQRSCAIRIIKNWHQKMLMKGPTLEARQRNIVKYSLQVGYLANRDDIWDRSKILLT